LLTQEEITKNVPRTESSRHWVEKAEIQMESDHLVLRLNWGKVIRVELATGKIGEMK
jgi:hypothetical protein